jgi:hypothetical protein
MKRSKILVNAAIGSWATTAYSLLGLKEYNAAHEPTHIYREFCGGYTSGFARDVGYWG